MDWAGPWILGPGAGLLFWKAERVAAESAEETVDHSDILDLLLEPLLPLACRPGCCAPSSSRRQEPSNPSRRNPHHRESAVGRSIAIRLPIGQPGDRAAHPLTALQNTCFTAHSNRTGPNRPLSTSGS